MSRTRAKHGEAMRLIEHAKHQDDACTPWPFALFKTTGYGQILFNGTPTGAHRVSLIVRSGPPPSHEHQAAHSCRDRSCFNIHHLSWKTAAENEADRLRDGTRVDRRGIRNTQAKLTEDQVVEMFLSDLSNTELAETYGISSGHVSAIKTGRKWASVTHDLHRPG